MDAEAILKLVGLAVSVLPGLVEAGVNIVDRVSKIKTLADSAAAGTTTDAEVKAVRDQLDSDLDEFNLEIPD